MLNFVANSAILERCDAYLLPPLAVFIPHTGALGLCSCS